MTYDDICDQCEEWMQPYMDRELDDAERAEAEAHLEGAATAASATASRRACGSSSARSAPRRWRRS